LASVALVQMIGDDNVLLGKKLQALLITGVIIDEQMHRVETVDTPVRKWQALV